MGLSTHILDTHRGSPVPGVSITLLRLDPSGPVTLGEGHTGSDGRCASLLGSHPLPAGQLCLRFHTAPYFAALGEPTLFPWVDIIVEIRSPEQHHHIPLLLAANGYTTYRGS